MRRHVKGEMAVIPAPRGEVLETLRKQFEGIPWVRTVLAAPHVASLHVWTIPPPRDEMGEEAIYAQELELIRAFPEEYFDFHFADLTQVDNLKRSGAVVAFTR